MFLTIIHGIMCVSWTLFYEYFTRFVLHDIDHVVWWMRNIRVISKVHKIIRRHKSIESCFVYVRNNYMYIYFIHTHTFCSETILWVAYGQCWPGLGILWWVVAVGRSLALGSRCTHALESLLAPVCSEHISHNPSCHYLHMISLLSPLKNPYPHIRYNVRSIPFVLLSFLYIALNCSLHQNLTRKLASFSLL
mgnify:CR=1 FL=1